jgi:hypothetical protein
MVWSEYLESTYYEQVPVVDNDNEEPPPQEPLQFEDWVDWYEPHLSNMWRDCVAYREDACINRDVGNHMDFWDFAKFMYDFSHQHGK